MGSDVRVFACHTCLDRRQGTYPKQSLSRISQGSNTSPALRTFITKGEPLQTSNKMLWRDLPEDVRARFGKAGFCEYTYAVVSLGPHFINMPTSVGWM